MKDYIANTSRSIVLATTNQDKFRDFKTIFKDSEIELKLPNELVKIKENGDDLLSNAKIKTLENSKYHPNQLVLSTDGGVKIPYLGSRWNHVLTKRLSGIDMNEDLTDRKRCEVLLNMMKDAKGEDRKIFWHEAFAIALNSEIIYTFEAGSPPGYLLEEIPNNFVETGYWIAYLWYKPEYKKTYMMLTDEEKQSAPTVTKLFREDLIKNLDQIIQ